MKIFSDACAAEAMAVRAAGERSDGDRRDLHGQSPTRKDAGAAATAPDAGSSKAYDDLHPLFTPTQRSALASMRPEAGRHAAAARTLFHALTLKSAWGWEGLIDVLQARLALVERMELARATLYAVPHALVTDLVDVLFGTYGFPPYWPAEAPDAAAWWADRATRPEPRAYAEATVRRLTPTERDDLRRRLRRS